MLWAELSVSGADRGGRWCDSVPDVWMVLGSGLADHFASGAALEVAAIYALEYDERRVAVIVEWRHLRLVGQLIGAPEKLFLYALGGAIPVFM